MLTLWCCPSRESLLHSEEEDTDGESDLPRMEAGPSSVSASLPVEEEDGVSDLLSASLLTPLSEQELAVGWRFLRLEEEEDDPLLWRMANMTEAGEERPEEEELELPEKHGEPLSLLSRPSR